MAERGVIKLIIKWSFMILCLKTRNEVVWLPKMQIL